MLDVAYHNVCVFLIDKELFGIEKDVMYVCSYIPPEGSPFYEFLNIDNGINLIEECLFDCLLSRDVYVILNGDLNSRTSNVSQNYFPDNVFNMQHKSQSLNINRRSQDSQINNYGKLLLNVCTALGLCILNGVC